MNTKFLQLAQGCWAVHGLQSSHLGRMNQALVDANPSKVAGAATFNWTSQLPGHRKLDTTQEFDMVFDYRGDQVTAMGLRFHAIINLGETINATITLEESAAPYVSGISENIMRILVAYHALRNGGFLLHSACFTDGEKAWLVFGHSGAGKSTCSEYARSRGLMVLSDDMNVLLPGSCGWQVFRVPFSGTCEQEYNGPASLPVALIAHLRQATAETLEPLSAATGVSLLSASAAFVNEDPSSADQLLGNCSSLLQYRAVQALYFRRGPEFLNLLIDHNDSKAVT